MQRSTKRQQIAAALAALGFRGLPAFGSYAARHDPKPRRKHVRSQGAQERERRLKQVRAGTLKGKFVSDDARYAAHGLIGPGKLVKP